MATETETKVTPPTVAELEAKAARLTGQVDVDTKAVTAVDEAVARAVKSGDVGSVLEVADKRTAAKATLAKSTSQSKTATNAVAHAKDSVFISQRADKDDATGKDDRMVKLMAEYVAIGATSVEFEPTEDGRTVLVSSVGPRAPKRSGGGGGGNGSRGQPLTVDGTEYSSASAAHVAFFPDGGPLNRDSIISKLEKSGHSVA